MKQQKPFRYYNSSVENPDATFNSAMSETPRVEIEGLGTHSKRSQRTPSTQSATKAKDDSYLSFNGWMASKDFCHIRTTGKHFYPTQNQCKVYRYLYEKLKTGVASVHQKDIRRDLEISQSTPRLHDLFRSRKGLWNLTIVCIDNPKGHVQLKY